MSGTLWVVPVNCLARFIRKTGPARNSRRKLVRKVDVFLRREHLLDLPKWFGVCVETLIDWTRHPPRRMPHRAKQAKTEISKALA